MNFFRTDTRARAVSNRGVSKKKPGAASQVLQLPMTMVSSSFDASLYLVKDDLAKETLNPVLYDFMKRSVEIHVLWPSSKQVLPKIRIFFVDDDDAASFESTLLRSGDTRTG